MRIYDNGQITKGKHISKIDGLTSFQQLNGVIVYAVSACDVFNFFHIFSLLKQPNLVNLNTRIAFRGLDRILIVRRTRLMYVQPRARGARLLN